MKTKKLLWITFILLATSTVCFIHVNKRYDYYSSEKQIKSNDNRVYEDIYFDDPYRALPDQVVNEYYKIVEKKNQYESLLKPVLYLFILSYSISLIMVIIVIKQNIRA